MSTQKKEEDNPTISNDSDLVYRLYSVLAYFLVLFVIGLPMWWHTTRVYRASLPIDRMFDVQLPQSGHKQLGVPLSLEYDILITIVHPEPENLNVELDGALLERHLSPYLARIGSVANFTVKSQWLYLVELGAIPRKLDDHYVLTEAQLPHVITPLEKKLWSHLSPRPCLNLVVYISHCDVPLFIYDNDNRKTDSNSFLSPGWGAITILNPDADSCALKEFKPEMGYLNGMFEKQLSNLFQGTDDGIDLVVRKAREMLYSTRRTLKSLAQLLSEIKSIVISDDVADKINVAIENADKTEQFLNEGSFEKALETAKIAFKNAEAAFSDPSLLALLYFPDDQKYAVYIPLFLPVMIPVLMSLLTIRKWYTSTRDSQIVKTKND